MYVVMTNKESIFLIFVDFVNCRAIIKIQDASNVIACRNASNGVFVVYFRLSKVISLF